MDDFECDAEDQQCTAQFKKLVNSDPVRFQITMLRIENSGAAPFRSASSISEYQYFLYFGRNEQVLG